MRIAILTDIHANREAFQSVLTDLSDRGIDRYALLGDIVGYGPDPEWCVDRAMELVAAGAWCIKGNHDSAIANPAESLNITARRIVNWTRPILSDEQREFLDRLPLTKQLDDILFVHASANDPADWNYVSSETRAIGSFEVSKARLIFCGHCHVPTLFSEDLGGRIKQQRIPPGMAIPLIRTRRWLAVIGSVGQPRDGEPQAAYAILDTDTNELTFRRIAYDVSATVSKIRRLGLPESLAIRLNTGA